MSRYNTRTVCITEVETGNLQCKPVFVRERSLFEQWYIRDFERKSEDGFTSVKKILCDGYGRVEIYYCPWTMRVTLAPWYLVWLRPMLRMRDYVVRYWGRFERRRGWIREGQMAHWPRWASIGW